MPWWGWHACPLAPRNWCLGGFNTPFCLKKSLGNSWTSSFLSLKCWRTSGKWLKWTCTYCGLGMFTSFFSSHFWHIAALYSLHRSLKLTRRAQVAITPSLWRMAVAPSQWGRLVNHPYLLEIGATYMHTQIVYIYIYVHICVYMCMYIYIPIIYHTPNREKIETWKYDVNITYTCPHHPGNTFASFSILRPFAPLSSLRRRWRDDMCNGNVHQHV